MAKKHKLHVAYEITDQMRVQISGRIIAMHEKFTKANPDGCTMCHVMKITGLTPEEFCVIIEANFSQEENRVDIIGFLTDVVMYANEKRLSIQ